MNLSKWHVVGFAAGAAALGGAWWFLTRNNHSRQHEQELERLIAEATPAQQPDTAPIVPAAGSTPAHFPIERGHRNELVRKLQRALMAKHPGQLPAGFSDDAIFGSLTERALTTNGYPSSVSLAVFQQITAQSSAAPTNFDARALAQDLHRGINGNKWAIVQPVLMQITSPSDYKAVRTEYLKHLTYLLKRGTPVTMLLLRFPQKRAELETAFTAMGLTKDSQGNWQMPLNSLGAPPAILATTAPANIWDGQAATMRVPANTILGTFVQSRNGWTTFRAADGNYLYVQAKWVKPITHATHT